MKKYLLGADGGGTKTAFLLTDTECNPVAEITLSRSNPNDIGIDNTIALILEGFSSLCKQADITPSEIAAVYAGISGVTAGNFATRIKSAVSDVYLEAKVEVNHDGVNILYAAFPDSDGVGVICGTGTSCFAKKGDILHRIGGYGLFDLLGGGYEIGRAAISHALRSIDGRDNESQLSLLVKKKTGFDLLEGLGTLIASGKNNIASYAPLVYDAYLKSDKYAEDILEAHIGYLAELINTAKRFFDSTYTVSLAGSMGKNPVTMKILKPKLASAAEVSTLECDPIYGAAARAKVLLQKGI